MGPAGHLSVHLCPFAHPVESTWDVCCVVLCWKVPCHVPCSCCLLILSIGVGSTFLCRPASCLSAAALHFLPELPNFSVWTLGGFWVLTLSVMSLSPLPAQQGPRAGGKLRLSSGHEAANWDEPPALTLCPEMVGTKTWFQEKHLESRLPSPLMAGGWGISQLC